MVAASRDSQPDNSAFGSGATVFGSGRGFTPRTFPAADTEVVFELLESILLEEESSVFKCHLKRVRDAGIGVEIDDFGSGHASILSVMQIAPSALKIDRRLISPISKSSRARKMVQAIIEIANTLDVKTIAEGVEGVETEEQARILREEGCDVLQGFFFAPALCEEDLFSFVSSDMSVCAQDIPDQAPLHA